MTKEEFLARLDELPDSQLLREEHVASWLQLSLSKIQKDRVKGGGIPYIKVGGAVRYRVGEIRKYIGQAEHSSTSEYIHYFETGENLKLFGPRLPFLRVNGKLYNFFESLSLDQEVEGVVWLDQRQQKEKGLE